jgi:hypothetical protein
MQFAGFIALYGFFNGFTGDAAKNLYTSLFKEKQCFVTHPLGKHYTYCHITVYPCY